MNNESGITLSPWMEINIPEREKLSKDAACDVCIIGGGIAGLTCAYTLSKLGKSVILIDDGPLAGGETSRTTGHLCSALDDRFTNLKSLFGLEGAKLAVESHKSAIAYIEDIIQSENINCDFAKVNGYLFAPPEEQCILDEEASCLNEMGNLPFSWVDKAPINSFDTGRALCFPSQAEFHILKYLKGLSEAIEKKGGKIYTHTRAEKIEETQVTTDEGFKINSPWIIVATNSPVNNRVTMHTKQASYRTYVLGALVPQGTIERALYWDTLDPYHYIRVYPFHDESKEMLLIGGEDHRTGLLESPLLAHHRLTAWAAARFPIEEILFQWSGQIIEPVDSLAFIGKNPDSSHIFIATGDSGNGLTHGTLAGMIIPDLILGKKNPYENLYSPKRKTIQAAAEFIVENANTLEQYGDWLLAGDTKSISSIEAGEGGVVRQGASFEAIYRDKKGCLHRFSAVCPHLGGIVHWNTFEKTWDCPCHGSRFKSEGTVVNGPANGPLKSLD